MIAHLIERLSRVPELDEIVLATTVNATDDGLAAAGEALGVRVFRGSEDDVLQRVLRAAESASADILVEITGDCPLLDPLITSQVIRTYLANRGIADYVSNVLEPSFPIGMDAQVYAVDLLRRADREGDLPQDREHVTWYFLRNRDTFRCLMLPAPPQWAWPELRLTLDERSDYEMIDRIFQKLLPVDPKFGCAEILELLRREPSLLEINAHVRQRKVSVTA